MTCDQAIELLPWYLNRTLDAGERAQVQEHLETCGPCGTALAETRQAASVFARHVPTAGLVAIAWGEPPAGIDPVLAGEHLASCPECAAELELARMSRRLEEEDNVAVFPPARKLTAVPAVARRSTGGWRAAALAASLGGLVAASGWVYSARDARQLADRLAAQPPAASTQVAQAGAPAPQAVTFLNVAPDQAVERGKAAEPAELPAAASPPVLALVTSGTGVYDEYQIEVRDERGVLVTTAPGIQKDPNGFYPVLLPRGTLKPGTYRLHVFGVAGSRREPLETYTIQKRQGG
ncbi:MAG TPA: zf-HC2 domain-containing protein [Thermoanaerobaculia bacterium]|nr:zf-HC2 domain-containing protein [Thermoanaerobaculia bacterium]